MVAHTIFAALPAPVLFPKLELGAALHTDKDLAVSTKPLVLLFCIALATQNTFTV
jgi:hypothetical protein